MAQTAGNVKRAIQVSSPCVRSVCGAHPSRSLGRARRRWAPATGASRGTSGWTEPVRPTTTAPPLSPPAPPLHRYHCAATKPCLHLGSIVIANAATVSRLRPLQGVRQCPASRRVVEERVGPDERARVQSQRRTSCPSITASRWIDSPRRVASSSSCVSTAAAGTCTYRTTEPRMKALRTAICEQRQHDGGAEREECAADDGASLAA
jgi:hypothetical protein